MKGLRVFYSRNTITGTYILFFPLLFLLSVLYAGCLALIRFCYKKGLLSSYRSKCRVISVGNITLGGSGKTPLVEYLTFQLSCSGHRVAVLMRGYKKPKSQNRLGSKSYGIHGDEAAMLRHNLQGMVDVLVGANRQERARRIDEGGRCDTIILDDGFQHWRLKRDLDIVAIDTTNPFGRRWLLPAGTLREALNALKRADIFCLTRINEADQEKTRYLESLLRRINPRAAIVKAIHVPLYLYSLGKEERLTLDILKDSRVALLGGIANPFSFFRTVERAGARVVLKSFFEDHHEFTIEEISDFFRGCQESKIKTAITTEKDAVRLEGLLHFKNPRLDILVLRIVLKIVEGQEALDERISSLYRS